MSGRLDASTTSSADARTDGTTNTCPDGLDDKEERDQGDKKREQKRRRPEDYGTAVPNRPLARTVRYDPATTTNTKN